MLEFALFVFSERQGKYVGKHFFRTCGSTWHSFHEAVNTATSLYFIIWVHCSIVLFPIKPFLVVFHCNGWVLWSDSVQRKPVASTHLQRDSQSGFKRVNKAYREAWQNQSRWFFLEKLLASLHHFIEQNQINTG